MLLLLLLPPMLSIFCGGTAPSLQIVSTAAPLSTTVPAPARISPDVLCTPASSKRMLLLPVVVAPPALLAIRLRLDLGRWAAGP